MKINPMTDKPTRGEVKVINNVTGQEVTVLEVNRDPIYDGHGYVTFAYPGRPQGLTVTFNNFRMWFHRIMV